MLRGRILINRTPAAMDPNGWVAEVVETMSGEVRYRKTFRTRNEALQAIGRYLDRDYYERRAK